MALNDRGRGQEFDRLYAEIPEYDRFFAVDELLQRGRSLAQSHPDVVKLKRLGVSRQGRPIECLRIGEGRRTALLFGCPHPNEPIGAMTLEYLAGRLATDAALRDEYDFTWYIIKCIDPDGTYLNQGWFTGPFTVQNYAMHFYRPAGEEQVEWTFPIKYKKLEFDRPLPETRALMSLIDEIKPEFMYSLHNAGFGGVYFYLSREAPDLYWRFHRLALESGIPLSLGEPEIPCAARLDKGIYRLTSAAELYDYYAQYADEDRAAQMILAGASSNEYASKYGTFTLVSELPYFYDARISDETPSGVNRRQAVLSALREMEDLAVFMRSLYDRMKDLVRPRRSRSEPASAIEIEYQAMAASLWDILSKLPQRLQAQRRWAEESSETDREATVAEAFDSLVVSKFYSSLWLGMLGRMAGAAAGLAEHEDLETMRREAWNRFDSVISQMESALNYSAISIRKLVAFQAATAFEAMRWIQDRA